ncbi:hypothetical protein QMQ05_11255 [Glutamicibacter ectropisis]|uniref:Uncharacterized protein n=1 Tax=Glutamicibacter ectropisis TaxID=3046593 RepID=A0AAU6WBL7_9MICC
MMNEEELPQAHKNFTRHFTATFYEDESCEFAPFGSDEGWDTLQEAAEYRNELNSGSTVADVLEITEAPISGEWGKTPSAEEWYEDATFIVAAAFTLLRLTGQIDEAGRVRALEALDILIEFFGDEPELLQQKEDLQSWKS